MNITDSSTITTENPDPVLYSVAAANLLYATAEALVSTATAHVLDIISANNTGLTEDCSKCVPALLVGRVVAKLAAFYVPDVIVALQCLPGHGVQLEFDLPHHLRGHQLRGYLDTAASQGRIRGLGGKYICSSLELALALLLRSPPSRLNSRRRDRLVSVCLREVE